MKNMLIKLGGLTSDQFASLSDFLAGEENLVYTPKSSDGQRFITEHGAGRTKCTNNLFCRMVKASQLNQTVNQVHTEVTLEIVTELTIEGKESGTKEVYPVPRLYLDRLLVAMNVMAS